MHGQKIVIQAHPRTLAHFDGSETRLLILLETQFDTKQDLTTGIKCSRLQLKVVQYNDRFDEVITGGINIKARSYSEKERDLTQYYNENP